MDYDKYIFGGNLTRDPAFGTTKAGKEYAVFSVAVNNSYKDREGKRVDRVKYISVFCSSSFTIAGAKMLQKGSKVLVDGSPEIGMSRSKDGSERAEIKVQANSVVLMSKPVRQEDTSFDYGANTDEDSDY